RFAAPARDDDPDAAAAQIAAGGPAAVPLIPRNAIRAQPRPATSRAAHRPTFQQRPQRQLLVALATGHDQDDGLATTLSADVELGAEATATPAKGVIEAPFFAPAACWWARMTLPSTKWSVQSNCPAASAVAWQAARRRS